MKTIPIQNQESKIVANIERAVLRSELEIFKTSERGVSFNEMQRKTFIHWIFFLNLLCDELKSERKNNWLILGLFSFGLGASLAEIQESIMTSVSSISIPFWNMSFLLLWAVYLTFQRIIEFRKFNFAKRIGRLRRRILNLTFGDIDEEGEDYQRSIEEENRRLGNEWVMGIAESLSLAAHIAQFSWSTPIIRPVLRGQTIEKKKEYFKIERNPKR